MGHLLTSGHQYGVLITIVWLIYRGCAALFLVAAWKKGRGVATFEFALEEYQLLPRVITRVVARTIIVLEAVVGISLLVPSLAKAGAAIASALLAGFALAMTINLLRGRQIACGCAGGTSQSTISWVRVLENASLAIVLLSSLLTSAARPPVWTNTLADLFAVLSIVLFQEMQLVRANGLSRQERRDALQSLRERTSCDGRSVAVKIRGTGE